MARYFLALLIAILAVAPLPVAATSVGDTCSTTVLCSSGQSCNDGVCKTSSSSGGSGSLYNPLGTTDLWKLVDTILAFVIKVGAVVIVFMIVYVGFKFVTAQGNETRLTEAKHALLWTIVGAVVLLGAQVISAGICETVKALTTGSTVTCT